MINKNYGVLNLSFIDRVIKMKRLEMLNILRNNIKDYILITKIIINLYY